MDLSKFAERLKEFVEDSGLSASDLGEKLGLGNSAISHYLSGRYLPSLQAAIKMADYFNCSLDYLLGLSDCNSDKNFKSCPPFGERFKAICKEKGVSRYKLRELANISETTIRYWVNGTTLPSITSLALIASKLKCSVDYLIGRES